VNETIFTVVRHGANVGVAHRIAPNFASYDFINFHNYIVPLFVEKINLQVYFFIA
jgi:hypothetical protein